MNSSDIGECTVSFSGSDSHGDQESFSGPKQSLIVSCGSGCLNWLHATL